MNDAPAPTCYRHPDRPTSITCRRCGRPICGECMVPAPVGFQCVDCVRAHTRATRQNQGVFGGQMSSNARHTSIVLIVINAVVWGAIQVAGFLGIQTRVVQFLGLLPQGMCVAADSPNQYWVGVDAATCRAISGSAWVPGVADGAWWQIFTSIFTHVNIMHIGLNCLTLWFLGPALESFLGRRRFLATYLVAGLVGSLFVYWLSPVYSLSYGGSGSLFGLMGALLLILWRQRMDVKQLLMWLALNVMITFMGGASISWQAHLGGLVGGALLACVWAFVPQSPSRTRNQWILVGVLVVAVLAGMVARTVILA
ncbi:MAG: rhomboid family intramembrane serine protease [Propionibacteriaceae bacterium]|nr:rhomboid family intramembrane serine protease [Propionibacteriaceae bacterium]